MIWPFMALLIVAFLPAYAGAARPALIPLPSSVTWGEGDFSLRANTTVEGQGAAAATAAYLSKALGLKEGAPRGPRIRLALVSETIVPGREDYRLAVARNVVRIEASHPEGLFYGAQTLLQLVAKRRSERARYRRFEFLRFPPAFVGAAC